MFCGRSSVVECFLAKEEVTGANPVARSKKHRANTADLFIKRFIAEVAELADAHGSGPCPVKRVWVQLPPSAQINLITLCI